MMKKMQHNDDSQLTFQTNLEGADVLESYLLYLLRSFLGTPESVSSC